jgi:hypothetical protein
MAGEAATVADPVAAGNSIMDDFFAVQEELGGAMSPEEQAADLAAPPPSQATAPAKSAAEKQKTATEYAQERRAEREAKREAKRQDIQRIADKESAADRKLAEATARAAALDAISPEKVRAMFSTGDFDGVAKAWGFKSWNDMNGDAARTFASPEFKRVQALEEQLAEKNAREEQSRKEWDRQQAAAKEDGILRNFHAQLTESLPKAPNETVAALAQEDPRFVTAVFQRVVAAAREGEDLDPVEVAEELIEDVRAHYESLSKVFRSPSKTEAAQAASPVRAGSTKQPVKPQTHVSRSAGTEASPPKLYSTSQTSEWLADTARDMKAAQDADRKALKAG